MRTNKSKIKSIPFSIEDMEMLDESAALINDHLKIRSHFKKSDNAIYSISRQFPEWELIDRSVDCDFRQAALSDLAAKPDGVWLCNREKGWHSF